MSETYRTLGTDWVELARARGRELSLRALAEQLAQRSELLPDELAQLESPDPGAAEWVLARVTEIADSIEGTPPTRLFALAALLDWLMARSREDPPFPAQLSSLTTVPNRVARELLAEAPWLAEGLSALWRIAALEPYERIPHSVPLSVLRAALEDWTRRTERS